MMNRRCFERGEIFLETLLFAPFLLGLGLLGLDYGIALHNRAELVALISSELRSSTGAYPFFTNEEIEDRSTSITEGSKTRLRNALLANSQIDSFTVDVELVWEESNDSPAIFGFYTGEMLPNRSGKRAALRITVNENLKGFFGKGNILPLPRLHEEQTQFLRNSAG